MVTTPIPEVLTYFRSPRRSQPVWELHLGLAGLSGALVLILTNLNDLVGGSSVLAWVIVGVLVAAFAGGVAVGRRAR